MLGMMDQANGIVGSATEYLRSQFGADFQECVSVGVIGSYARDALCAVSDIDYYVVFDLVTLKARGGALSNEEMGAAVDGVRNHVQEAYPDQALAKRFSIFWTTLGRLQGAQYDVGRWPPYDREVLRRQGKHLAGKVISKDSLPMVSQSEIILDSAKFLVEIIQPKLDSVKLFRTLDGLGAVDIGALDDVVRIKSVLMPVRLLYILLPVHEASLIVDTEAAVAACAAVYHDQKWWGLVESALQWRQSPPIERRDFESAAVLLRSHVTDLYIFCLNRFSDVLREHGEIGLRMRLDRWSNELLELQGRRDVPGNQ